MNKNKNESLRVFETRTNPKLEQINSLFLETVKLKKENEHLRQLIAKAILVLGKELENA